MTTVVPDEGAGLSAGGVARRLGVAVTTIRTWDRRYGLGPEQREPGRHRRYRPRDVARLEVMHRLTSEGITASEAARFARGVPDQRLLSSPDEVPRPSGRTAGPPTDVARVRGLLRAATAMDGAAVHRIVDRAVSGGVITAWEALLCPTLRCVGARYEDSGGYVESEHLLSSVISGVLGAVRPARGRPRVLLACAPDEQHSLALEGLAAALSEHGAASWLLGPRVPTPALCDAITRTGAEAVVLWAQTPDVADTAQLEVATSVRPRPPVVLAAGPGHEGCALPGGVRAVADLRTAVDLLTTGMPTG